MRLIALLSAAAAALGAGAAAPPQPTVEIKDAVAQVTVVPEDRADIRVEVVTHNRSLPLKIRQARARTIVDGGLGGQKIRGCSGPGEPAAARVAGLGEIALKDMPHIVVHAPRDVNVYAGGAVYGAVGRAHSVLLGNAGCGDWTVANVEHRLQLSLAGSGGARAGAAGEAKLRVAGAGDIAAGPVRGPLAVDVAGAGDVRVASMSGPLEVSMTGSGDVVIERGRATAAKLSVAGSGNVLFGGTADTLTARVTGSGDVSVGAVRGEVRKSVVGSGRVRVRQSARP